MVYKNNIPQPTDSPAVDSQADLLENFTQLENQFSADHVSLTEAVNVGMHTQVRFEDIAADPNLPDPQASLYLKLVGVDSELFFQNFNTVGAVNVDRQMTNLTLNAYANLGTAGGNGTYIDTPWGLRIFRLLTNAFTGNATIIVPVGSGTFLDYQLTPNTATASATGAVVSNVTTLTAGNANNQSLRVQITMQLP